MKRAALYDPYLDILGGGEKHILSILKVLEDEGYEIIVVDSESETETEEMISENFPAVVFIPFEQNVGYAKLVNAGIRDRLGFK